MWQVYIADVKFSFSCQYWVFFFFFPFSPSRFCHWQYQTVFENNSVLQFSVYRHPLRQCFVFLCRLHSIHFFFFFQFKKRYTRVCLFYFLISGAGPKHLIVWLLEPSPWCSGRIVTVKRETTMESYFGRDTFPSDPCAAHLSTDVWFASAHSFLFYFILATIGIFKKN